MYNEKGAGWIGENDGLGPAQLRGFRLLIDGVEEQPSLDFSALVVKGLNLPSQGNYKFLNPAAGVMLQPGHAYNLFWADPGPAIEILMGNHRKVDLEFCYCSIYTECWISHSGTTQAVRDDSCSTFQNEPRSLWWNG
jgi:hypothetical protein